MKCLAPCHFRLEKLYHFAFRVALVTSPLMGSLMGPMAEAANEHRDKVAINTCSQNEFALILSHSISRALDLRDQGIWMRNGEVTMERSKSCWYWANLKIESSGRFDTVFRLQLMRGPYDSEPPMIRSSGRTHSAVLTGLLEQLAFSDSVALPSVRGSSAFDRSISGPQTRPIQKTDEDELPPAHFDQSIEGPD